MPEVGIGIGGPVGSGKTRLIERLLPLLTRARLRVAVITNDLVTTEDAERVQRSGLIDPRAGGRSRDGRLPAHRDPRGPVGEPRRRASGSSRRTTARSTLIIIESGGDNLAATFTSDLVDHWTYVIDTAAGDDIPRKRGLGMLRADLLVVNKIDLAPYVGADLERMRADVAVARPDRPSLFTDLTREDGAEPVFARAAARDPVRSRSARREPASGARPERRAARPARAG